MLVFIRARNLRLKGEPMADLTPKLQYILAAAAIISWIQIIGLAAILIVFFFKRKDFISPWLWRSLFCIGLLTVLMFCIGWLRAPVWALNLGIGPSVVITYVILTVEIVAVGFIYFKSIWRYVSLLSVLPVFLVFGWPILKYVRRLIE